MSVWHSGTQTPFLQTPVGQSSVVVQGRSVVELLLEPGVVVVVVVVDEAGTQWPFSQTKTPSGDPWLQSSSSSQPGTQWPFSQTKTPSGDPWLQSSSSSQPGTQWP